MKVIVASYPRLSSLHLMYLPGSLPSAYVQHPGPSHLHALHAASGEDDDEDDDEGEEEGQDDDDGEDEGEEDDEEEGKGETSSESDSKQPGASTGGDMPTLSQHQGQSYPLAVV